MKNRRMKKIDLLAAGLLLASVSVSAVAQFGPWVPVMTYCPPDKVHLNGVPYYYSGIWCPAGSDCGITITVNSDGTIHAVDPACVPASN